MALSRRELLAALGVAAAGLGGCSHVTRRTLGQKLPGELHLPERNGHPTARLLHRVGFGPTPGQVLAVSRQGHEAYLAEQLAAAQAEPPDLQFDLARLDIHRFHESELRDLPREEVIAQLQQAALLRAVYSPNQLRERVVDFWTNHFNIYARKEYAGYRLATDSVQVVRRHALGSFPEMLRASAHSPAMLAYLDNQQNVGGVANENYARELLELHTLGVHGGYTATDVREVARCFTGWTVEDRFLRPRGRFRFDETKHDDGVKHVLGHTIAAGGGQRDGERVLEILAEHPATASHLSTKLCRFFLGEGCEAVRPLVENAYVESKGDVREMLKPILGSEELLNGPPILKRPFDFVASSLRALHANSNCGKPVLQHLERMGQPLHEWPMPDGYPDRTSAWTGSLLARWNFALALTSGAIGGSAVDGDLLRKLAKPDPVSGLCEVILSCEIERCPEVARVVRTHLDQTGGVGLTEAAALCLASPDFQWR